jgi:lipopolysaccharide transport system permease protein
MCRSMSSPAQSEDAIGGTVARSTPAEWEELIIEAGRLEKTYWRDLWRYRELFYFLAWRDILVRYKQTTIGVLWAVLRPLITMVIFTVVFGTVAHLPSDGIPYPLVVFAALLPWQLFSAALTDAGGSLVNNANMVSKVYFPRLMLPMSTIAVALVDFGMSLVLFGALLAYYHCWPDWRLALLPLFILLGTAAAIGPGLWFSALTVRYRDFRYLVPFIVQLGIFLSPVGFTSDVVPQRLRLVYSLNPMVGVIEGFRWSLLGGRAQLYWPGFSLSLGLIVALLISGVIYFRGTERSFADVV